MSLLRMKVVKRGGSFEHSGTVVSEFLTTAGQHRIVLEFDAPVEGMLHIYRPDQVEPKGDAALQTYKAVGTDLLVWNEDKECYCKQGELYSEAICLEIVNHLNGGFYG